MSSINITRDERDPARLAAAIVELAQGRSNAVGRVTLRANNATTVVPAENCGEGSIPLLIPMSANAGAEIGNGTLHVSAVANGSFTITHANNAQTDRNFGWFAVG